MVIMSQYKHVLDRQTDRQTDTLHKSRSSTAEREKKLWMNIFM